MEIIDNTQKNENEKAKKTPKELTLFILSIVGNVVFYVIIIMLFLFSIMNINGGTRTEGVPNIFGRGFTSVLTPSMDGDITEYEVDSFKEGDLVKLKVFKEDDCSSLEVGDVITFYDAWIKDNYPEYATYLNTHRIVYVHSDGSYVITMGDRLASDPTVKFDINDADGVEKLLDKHDIQIVHAEDIRGVVTGVSKGAGKTLINIQDNWLWFFVIPVLVFLLIEIFLVIKNIMDLKGAKQKAELANDKDAMMAELEAQKEAMRQQILAELAAQQAQSAPEEAVAEPVVEDVPAEEVVAEPVVEDAPQEEPAAEEVKEEEVTEEENKAE